MNQIKQGECILNFFKSLVLILTFLGSEGFASSYFGCPNYYPDGSVALINQELRYPDGSFADSNYGSSYPNGNTMTYHGQWFYSDGKNMSYHSSYMPDGSLIAGSEKFQYSGMLWRIIFKFENGEFADVEILDNHGG